MKLHFEPNLDYQIHAIDAVCDLFRGQEICRTEFTVTQNLVGGQQSLAFPENSHGVGNRLTLLDDALLKNLGDIQLRNGLAPSGSLASGDFTVEMETGTGKTYVYLRTIFELNKRFGFTKFVIVVPCWRLRRGFIMPSRLSRSICDRFTAVFRFQRATTTLSTTRRSSARCATLQPALKSRSWW